jgi:hypothetical protein
MLRVRLPGESMVLAGVAMSGCTSLSLDMEGETMKIKGWILVLFLLLLPLKELGGFATHI